MAAAARQQRGVHRDHRRHPPHPPRSYGDHHILIVDTATCRLRETYHSYLTAGTWNIYGAASFDLRSNALNPADWTSADAAGFPILPLLARADEASTGEIVRRRDLGRSVTATRPDAEARETVAAVTVAGQGRAAPRRGAFHGLLGVQANLWKLKVFVQTTAQPVREAGIGFGTRFTW